MCRKMKAREEDCENFVVYFIVSFCGFSGVTCSCLLIPVRIVSMVAGHLLPKRLRRKISGMSSRACASLNRVPAIDNDVLGV
jgi:hypothetical protein